MADNKGIPQELIDRINELSKKKKEEGLTSEELAEQKNYEKPIFLYLEKILEAILKCYKYMIKMEKK